jgi:hypothetical protein
MKKIKRTIKATSSNAVRSNIETNPHFEVFRFTDTGSTISSGVYLCEELFDLTEVMFKNEGFVWSARSLFGRFVLV